MPKRSACNLRSLNTSPVPLARISELNQARSLRCSVRGTGSSGMPLQRGGSGRKALLGGGEVPAVAAVLGCPWDSALFPPRVRRSRFSGFVRSDPYLTDSAALTLSGTFVFF
ncbi:hypothetical protein Anapl_01279 [Anas platyrhynchos]|uniref:Uncharacterized protein n=1 Tax=Anas platyrhynchos TaxID=8839 RepID=R0LII8_ANAPL|nr:hypothetical protein Anapl_01279 [Anas platyrhynchos]